MSEKVSVIIPVYKVEKYLNRCVESVVNQTYSNLEIILVDDGSPDNCPQMCDEWAVKDERIKVIHKENAGVGIARNSGMKMATGDYLMFVDSDDYLSLNAVMVLLTRMKSDQSDMAEGKHVDICDDGRIDDTFCSWMRNQTLTKQEVLRRMGSDQRIIVMACMKMYRKEVFDDIRFPALSCGEDCWIFSDVIEKCNRISIVEDLVYYYYQRADSILHQKTEQRQLDDIRANLKLAHYLYMHDCFEGARKWYEIALDKTNYIKDAKAVRNVFNAFFSDAEERSLLKDAGAKLRVKWICRHVPQLRQAIRTLKHTVRRFS